MIIAVTGSRTFADYEMLSATLDALQPSEILAGGAKGADTFARQYALERGIAYREFLPAFNTDPAVKYHARHYLARNRAMVDAADMVAAFWDGKSKGTACTVRHAHKTGKPVRLVLF